MAAALFVVLVLVVGIAIPLAIYAAVRDEHNRRETMDREAAERAARRDTPDDVDGRDPANGFAGRNAADENDG